MKVNCTEITKEDTRATRWLQAGTNDTSRHFALACLSIEDDIAVSADGFEIRAMSTPKSLQEYSGQLIKLDKSPRVAGDVVKTQVVEDESFPDWRGVVPTDEPVFEITLNGELLADIVAEMGAVSFQFFSSTVPIVMRSVDKFAVLMPMHKGSDDEWFDPNNPPQLSEESN